MVKMFSAQLTSYFPVKTSVFLFILWANSSYAPAIKNAGFYCDDDSIKRPYNGDTVHYMSLLTVLLGIFPLIIHLTELFSRKSEEELAKFSLRVLLRYYYTGFLFILGFTEVIKLTVCELRPHFLTSCLPDMNEIKCSDGYITQFNCTGKGRPGYFGKDIYKSFPSGHAVLSFFSLVFFTIYLSSRMKMASSSAMFWWWSRSTWVLAFLWTMICCITRILDFRHFWWDVLAGIFIGLCGGLVTVNMALKRAWQKKSTSNGT